ncbi:hypothetical protein ACFQDD_00480 [Halorubrum pallidum]|uniref:Uncharacterized protein n=1 Tax=Halorubrum pallidum TaxID=1526114 RepID=A0ABD5SYF3_9EURY
MARPTTDATHAISEATIDTIMTDYDGGVRVSDGIRRRQFNTRLKEFQVNFVDEELLSYVSLALSNENQPPVRQLHDEGVIIVNGVIESVDACVPDGHADAEREKIIPAIKRAHELEVRERFPEMMMPDPTVCTFIFDKPDGGIPVPITGDELSQ